MQVALRTASAVRPIPGAVVVATDPRSSGNPPVLPTFIRPEPANPVTFGDLTALARYVAALRKGRALRLSYAAHTRLGRTFPAVQVFAVEADESEVWLGAAAIQSRDPETLSRALERVDPQ